MVAQLNAFLLSHPVGILILNSQGNYRDLSQSAANLINDKSGKNLYQLYLLQLENY